MSRFANAAEFERWFGAEVKAGRSPDALHRYIAEDETERFFSHVRVGADHDYWQGPWFFRRNDGSTQHARRWLMSRRFGRPLRMPHEVVETTCKEARCVRLSHLRIRQHAFAPMTEGEAIAMIRACVRDLGHLPTRREWAGSGMPSPQVLERIFGSVDKGIGAAGFNARPQGGNVTLLYSDDQIRQAVRETVAELGYVPNRSWWENERHSPSFRTVQRRFGSIKAALNS